MFGFFHLSFEKGGAKELQTGNLLATTRNVAGNFLLFEMICGLLQPLRLAKVVIFNKKETRGTDEVSASFFLAYFL